MPTEVITWRAVADGLPDADLTVLLAMSDGDTCAGFVDGTHGDGSPIWRDTTAIELHAHDVTHWAEMPAGPNEC